MDTVRYGRLVAVKPAVKIYNGRPSKAMHCICDCGAERVVALSNLVSGATTSCGCYRNQRIRETTTTHGLAKTPIYRTWIGMLRRCENPTHKHYSYYGGRGISVCAEWHDIAVFRADMGDPPHGATLDRIDSNGHYEPSNCRWATRAQQARNTRVHKNSKSGAKGVHWVPRVNLWYSQITADGKSYGGYSRTLLDAVALRYRLEREHWTDNTP